MKHRRMSALQRRYFGKHHSARTSRGSYFHRRSGGKSGGIAGEAGLILGAALYGAGREYLAAKVAPLTSKIPAGQYADEVGLGILGYFLMKGKVPLLNKVPMSRDIGKAMVVIEAARIGAGVGGGLLAPTATPTVSNAIYGV